MATRHSVVSPFFLSPFSPRQKEGMGRSQLNLHLNSKTVTGAERAIEKEADEENLCVDH